MTAPVLSLTEDDMMTAVRAFLLAVLPDGYEVIRGQNNRVPMPPGKNFIVMTPQNRVRQATNQDSWTDAVTATYSRAASTKVVVQCDIYGSSGSDEAQIIATLWRDGYACDALAAAGLAPLYADDGVQMPLIDGEAQYEDRWKVNLAFQPKEIVVSTAQQFADTLAADIRGLK